MGLKYDESNIMGYYIWWAINVCFRISTTLIWASHTVTNYLWYDKVNTLPSHFSALFLRWNEKHVLRNSHIYILICFMEVLCLILAKCVHLWCAPCPPTIVLIVAALSYAAATYVISFVLLFHSFSVIISSLHYCIINLLDRNLLLVIILGTSGSELCCELWSEVMLQCCLGMGAPSPSSPPPLLLVIL